MTVHIGISGPIAAGKSTLAKGLAEVLGLMGKKAHIISFATGLKYLATLYNDPMGYKKAYDYFIDLGYTDEQALAGTKMLVEGFLTYPVANGVKPRKLFQFIGTEVGRDTVDRDIWIKDVQRKIASDPVDFVISDDMRFVNESYAVHIRVAITTEGQEDIYAMRKSLYPDEYFYSDHPSEKERELLYKPDFEIGINSKVSDVINLARSIILHTAGWFTVQTGTITADKIAQYSNYGYLLTSGTPMPLENMPQQEIDLHGIKVFDKDRFKSPWKRHSTTKLDDYTGE